MFGEMFLMMAADAMRDVVKACVNQAGGKVVIPLAELGVASKHLDLDIQKTDEGIVLIVAKSKKPAKKKPFRKR